MATKVLIVDPDIAFAIGIKRALEQGGGYRVTAFANGQAAVELIRAEPQDIAVLDFGISDTDLNTLIGALRAIQPGLFVLVSPRTAEHINRLAALDVQGSITKPYLARQLIPVIREAVAARARLAKKVKAPEPSPSASQTPKPPSRAPAKPSTEPPIRPDAAFKRQTSDLRPVKVGPAATPAVLRQTLEIAIQAAPPAADSVTIGELVSGSKPPPAVSVTPLKPPPVIKRLPPKPLAVEPPDAPDAPDAAPRPDVASAALGVLETMPLADFSLQAYVDQVEQQTGQPLLNEPSFVTSALHTDPLIDAPGDIAPPAAAVPDDAQFDVPDDIPALEPVFSDPPPALPDDADGLPADSVADSATDSATDSAGNDTPENTLNDNPAGTNPENTLNDNPALAPDMRADLIVDAPDPAAEIALQLVQLALQSAARAVVLTRGETVVAVAGDLSEPAVGGVVESLLQAWQSSPDDGSALIRFIQVPGVGDFLLYSMRSVDELRLSMLFPAETSLRVIRKQAQQLIAALEKPPAEAEAEKTLLSRPTQPKPPDGLREAAAEADLPAAESAAPLEAPPLVVEGPYSAYAFVWLPRADSLPPAVNDLLLGWLGEVAAAHAWRIEGTEIQAAYVSVQLSIPASETPTATIEALLRETAERAADADLWADAYYVVAPGRAVTQQEIVQFMAYRRTTEQYPAA